MFTCTMFFLGHLSRSDYILHFDVYHSFSSLNPIILLPDLHTVYSFHSPVNFMCMVLGLQLEAIEHSILGRSPGLQSILIARNTWSNNPRASSWLYLSLQTVLIFECIFELEMPFPYRHNFPSL